MIFILISLFDFLFVRMGDRIHVLDNGTLIIDMVNDKDAGDYVCVARSKMGDEFQLMTVSVSMKPAKIEPKHYGKKQIPFGRDLRVDCKASGSPQPDISWGLPDGTLVNSAMQSDSSSSDNGGRRNRRFVLFDNGTLYLNQVTLNIDFYIYIYVWGILADAFIQSNLQRVHLLKEIAIYRCGT